MVRTGAALSITNTGARQVVNSQVKQILRCFNAECTDVLDHLSVKNVDASRSKIQRAFDANNRIFSIDGVQLTHDYLAAKLEELSAIYTYLVKVEEEEEKRAIREQMLEEEKVRREIEREKKKIERDRQQFNQEIQRLMKYMQKTESDVEKQLYIDKIRELEDRASTPWKPRKKKFWNVKTMQKPALYTLFPISVRLAIRYSKSA